MSMSQVILMSQIRSFAKVKKFTKTHEWIEFDTDSKIGTIGITNHAQSELGEVVHVDLPDINKEFVKGDVISTIESTKTAADIYQMCDGEVKEVNKNLSDDPSLINSDPEGKGWIMKVKTN